MHVSKHLEKTNYGLRYCAHGLFMLLFYVFRQARSFVVNNIWDKQHISPFIYVCMYLQQGPICPPRKTVCPYNSHSVYQRGLLSSCVFSGLEQQVVRVGHRKGSGFQPDANILGEGVRWGKRVTSDVI